jgi:hypothetical protein
MSTIESSQAVSKAGIDLGRVFREAGRRFLDDVVPLVLATLVALLLSIVTLGVLAGPLYAGLLNMVIRRAREGRQPEVGDVFSCMDRFWSFLGAAVVLVLTIGLASITIVGGIVLGAIWLYVFPLMIDRRIGLWEAMRTSKDMVVRAGFWEHVALVILLAAVNALGHGPLVLLTIPFTVVATAVAYHQLETGAA